MHNSRVKQRDTNHEGGGKTLEKYPIVVLLCCMRFVLKEGIFPKGENARASSVAVPYTIVRVPFARQAWPHGAGNVQGGLLPRERCGTPVNRDISTHVFKGSQDQRVMWLVCILPLQSPLFSCCGARIVDSGRSVEHVLTRVGIRLSGPRTYRSGDRVHSAGQQFGILDWIDASQSKIQVVVAGNAFLSRRTMLLIQALVDGRGDV